MPGTDTNVLMDDGAGTGVPGVEGSPRVAVGSGYGQLSGALNYSLARGATSIGAAFGGTTQHYSDPSLDPVNSFHASLGGSLTISKRLALAGTQAARYEPYISLGLFPALFELPVGEGTAPGLDLVTMRQEHFDYDTRGEATLDISRRDVVQLYFQRQHSDFESNTLDFVNQGPGVRYTHGIAKGLGLRLGYAYNEIQYGSGVDAYERSARTWDVGFEFSRPLSFSRCTTLSFSTGTTGSTTVNAWTIT